MRTDAGIIVAQSTRPVTRLHQFAQLRDGITGAPQDQFLSRLRGVLMAASSDSVVPLTLFSVGLSRTLVAPARFARDKLVW